jgi:hypothetical protein
MIAVTANGLPETDSIANKLRRARTESVEVGGPTIPFTRENGMQLESGLTQELQFAATTLERARASLWDLIDDPRALPDEILQSTIRYWAAVRSLRMWLGAYGELRGTPGPAL